MLGNGTAICTHCSWHCPHTNHCWSSRLLHRQAATCAFWDISPEPPDVDACSTRSGTISPGPVAGFLLASSPNNFRKTWMISAKVGRFLASCEKVASVSRQRCDRKQSLVAVVQQAIQCQPDEVRSQSYC